MAPRLTVAGVAQRLGIAPATLRTWDRRYGIGPTEHASGSHRRYSPADVARLEAVRRLVLDGVPPGEAARVVLQGGYEGATGTPQFPDRHGALPVAPPTRPASPIPGADELVRRLDRAASSLSSEDVLDCLRQLLPEHGVVRAWEQVLVPVLVAAGARWERTGEGVEVEHLLSDCITAALRGHASSVVPSGGRPLLLACAPEEQHCLPMLALAAALAERGESARLLGAALPASALLAAVRRTGPAAVFLWSQLPSPGQSELLASLPVTRPPTAVIVGGPGWQPDLPARVSRADGLGAALDLLGRALRGQALASTE